jgi:hypothetical protein
MLKLIAIAIIALIIIIKIISIIYSIMKVSRCKHTRYYENMRCHARCLNCRKDLGFIQYSREKNPQGETGPQRYEFD